MTHRDHLVAMLAILKRQGGFMRPVDQCAVREAEASTAGLAEVEAALDRLVKAGAPRECYVRIVLCAEPGCLASIDDVLIASSAWHREVGHGGADWCPVHAPPRLARGTETTPVVVVQLQRDDRALAGTMRGRAGAAITAAHVRANVATLRDNAETDALIAAEDLPTSAVVPVVVPLDYRPPRRRLQPKSTALAERIAARARGELPRLALAISRRRKPRDRVLDVANQVRLAQRTITPQPRATFDIHDGAVTETTKERA